MMGLKHLGTMTKDELIAEATEFNTAGMRKMEARGCTVRVKRKVEA